MLEVGITSKVMPVVVAGWFALNTLTPNPFTPVHNETRDYWQEFAEKFPAQAEQFIDEIETFAERKLNEYELGAELSNVFFRKKHGKEQLVEQSTVDFITNNVQEKGTETLDKILDKLNPNVTTKTINGKEISLTKDKEYRANYRITRQGKYVVDIAEKINETWSAPVSKTIKGFTKWQEAVDFVREFDKRGKW